MSVKTNFTLVTVALPFLYILYSFFQKDFVSLTNSALTLLYILIFLFIYKKYAFFNGRLYYSSLIFILLSVFAGRTLNAYGYIPYWDKILHFFSGFIFVGVGKEIYQKLSSPVHSTWLSILFPLFFAIAAAGLWEMWEFAGDSLFGLSTQNNSLNDTMLDMILGSASALISVIFSKE